MPKPTTEQENFSTDLKPETPSGLTVRDILLMDGVPEEEIEQYLQNSKEK